VYYFLFNHVIKYRLLLNENLKSPSNLHTLCSSPSGDDTVGTIRHGSARNADGLHVVVERQRRIQPHHCYIIFIRPSGTRVVLVQQDRHVTDCLTMRIRRLSTAQILNTRN